MKYNIQKTLLHFSLLCILLAGCNTQTRNDKEKGTSSISADAKSEQILEMEHKALASGAEITKIKIDPNSKNSTVFALNDLVESIEYIPLETKDECVVGSINDRRIFKISDNFILVQCSKTGRFFLFNRKGGFIAQIGDIGEGPGEYLRTANSYFIDEENKQIILFAIQPDRFLYYDMTGKYIKSVQSENKDISERTGGTYESFFHEGLLLMIPNLGDVPYSYIILDNNLKTVAQHVKPLQFPKNPNFTVAIRPPFSYYVYGNKMHVRNNNLNDTLYFFENSQKIIPKYTINAGIYEVTTDLLYDQNFFSKTFLNMMSAFETKDHLFIDYRFKNKTYYCYFDKNKKDIFHFSSEAGIQNDFDGGLDFWPLQQYNDLLYKFYDAHLFEENAEKSNKIQPKGPKDAINKLKDFSLKIDAEDNPVLVIAKLKQ
jgi:hypothetical protein